MIDTLLELDRELFVFLNGLGRPAFDWLWLFITHEFSSTPVYALLLFGLYHKLGWKHTLLILIMTTLMITFTDQFSGWVKDTVQRPRPCQEASLRDIIRYIAPRCGRFTFFSGHASSSMAAAVFLGLILKKWYPKAPFLLLFWAATIAFSRIYVGVHYPLDLFVGMIFGALTGWGFYILKLSLGYKFKILRV